MNKQLETYALGAIPLVKQGKRVVVRHNGYCYYYDKQPRKTAQWKNEQRRFRK